MDTSSMPVHTPSQRRHGTHDKHEAALSPRHPSSHAHGDHKHPPSDSTSVLSTPSMWRGRRVATPSMSAVCVAHAPHTRTHAARTHARGLLVLPGELLRRVRKRLQRRLHTLDVVRRHGLDDGQLSLHVLARPQLDHVPHELHLRLLRVRVSRARARRRHNSTGTRAKMRRQQCG